MTPYFQDKWTTLYHADCRAILPTLTPGSVDLVLTDPPYGMNNNNDYSRFTTGPNAHGAAASRTYNQTVGDDSPFDPSPLLDFKKVILWGFNHFAARLPVGTALVWIKRLDGGFGSFLSDAELGWMKTGHGVYCYRDTSLLAETKARVHPNQKPVGLMKWCILKSGIAEGDTILDPFAGSGTTLVAAKQMGRKSIGVEIEERYCDIAAKRLEQGVLEYSEGDAS